MSGISTLFSSMNTSYLSSSIYGNLAEYASIRSGSFYKIAQKYYSNTSASGSTTGIARKTSPTEYDYKRGDYKKNLESPSKTDSWSTPSSTSTSKTSTASIASIEKNAESLKKSAAALTDKSSSSVFRQTGGKYDNDRIYDAVNSFVKDYNGVVDSVKGSRSSSISGKASSMLRLTSANSRLLGKIGITIGNDNKLSIDEKTFKNADMGRVKSLFNSSGSYGYQVGMSASMIDYAAQNEASRSNTYTNLGAYSYNYTAGNLFNYGL